MLKNLILTSVDLKKFDFRFFRDEPTKINEELFKIIIFDFPSGTEAINGLKNLLLIQESEFTELDKLAIYLFNRYYGSESKSDKSYIDELAKCYDKEILLTYFGKPSLSKKEREKLKSFSTLTELFAYFSDDKN